MPTGDTIDPVLLHRREIVLKELVVALRECHAQVQVPLLHHEPSVLIREASPLYREFAEDEKAHRARGELAREKLRRAWDNYLRIQEEAPSKLLADRIRSLDGLLEALDAGLSTPR